MDSHFWYYLPIAYLLGAIPTAVWWGKLFYHKDVRLEGSGNSGATNTFRVLGRNAGIPVLLIDMLKGFLACSLVYLHLPFSIERSDATLLTMVVLGLVAILGHIFPVFASFKGGKGVATSFGMVMALKPEAAGLALAIFLTVFITSKYVSLGSITAAVSFPILTSILFRDDKWVMVYFSVLLASVVVITHRKNIVRLLKGTESKIYLFGRKN